jgi:hypothetical protein
MQMSLEPMANPRVPLGETARSLGRERLALPFATTSLLSSKTCPKTNKMNWSNGTRPTDVVKVTRVMGREAKAGSEVLLEAVVLVPLDNVDRTKVDGGNLIGVVIFTDKNKTTCRVAVKNGVLQKAYAYHALKLLPGTSNDIDLNDLRGAFEDHGSLPKIAERQAARYVSSVGGQGIILCQCRSECKTNQCSCRKAGRLCTSRCHRNNHTCKNKQHVVDHGK